MSAFISTLGSLLQIPLFPKGMDEPAFISQVVNSGKTTFVIVTAFLSPFPRFRIIDGGDDDDVDMTVAVDIFSKPETDSSAISFPFSSTKPVEDFGCREAM